MGKLCGLTEKDEKLLYAKCEKCQKLKSQALHTHEINCKLNSHLYGFEYEYIEKFKPRYRYVIEVVEVMVVKIQCNDGVGVDFWCDNLFLPRELRYF